MSRKVAFKTECKIVGKEHSAAREKEVEVNGKKYGPKPESYDVYALVGTMSSKYDLFCTEPRVIRFSTTREDFKALRESMTTACEVIQNGERCNITQVDGLEVVGVEKLKIDEFDDDDD